MCLIIKKYVASSQLFPSLMLRLEGCHVFNFSSAGCQSLGAHSPTAPLSWYRVMTAVIPWHSIFMCWPLLCVWCCMCRRQLDSLKAKILTRNSLLRTRLFRYTNISIEGLTEEKDIRESQVLVKHVYRMSAWNQSALFSTSLLSTLVLKTQTGWCLMFFVTDTRLAVAIWISYCFVVQFQCLHNYGLIFLHLYVGNSITSHIL
jgi:hypothetical protein